MLDHGAVSKVLDQHSESFFESFSGCALPRVRRHVDGRRRAREFDEVRFRVLWAEGAGTQHIGDVFGISKQRVSVIASQLGLPSRDLSSGVVSAPGAAGVRVPTHRSADPERIERGLDRAYRAGALTERPGWSRERDAVLAATSGRYRKVAGLSARWGMSFTQVVARWHLMRRWVT